MSDYSGSPLKQWRIVERRLRPTDFSWFWWGLLQKRKAVPGEPFALFDMRYPAPEYEVENVLTRERRKGWSGYFFWAGDVVGEDMITFDDPVISPRHPMAIDVLARTLARRTASLFRRGRGQD